MRFEWLLVGAVLLSACGKPAENAPDPAIEATQKTVESASDLESTLPSEIEPVDSIDLKSISEYSADWSLNEYWTGEYPSGFLVYKDGVTVSGRSKPVQALAMDVQCPLEASANYQVWNRPRVEADEVVFFSANKTFPVTMTQDAAVEYATDDGVTTLDLKAGDQLTYLSYMSEGFAMFSFGGKEMDINESELREISDIGDHDVIEDQWARVNCTNGSRAWLLYSEVIEAPGVGRSPLIGYGEAYDITPEEAQMMAEEIGIPFE